ncbi:MAG: hypothetical protein QOJ09_2708 [Actinomycetota bacterium]|nr:hypothetical protein [Actinomycetota bacterium]
MRGSIRSGRTNVISTPPALRGLAVDAAEPVAAPVGAWFGPNALAPLCAAVGALLVWRLGVRGVDVPAQVYRLELFRTSGWVVWDVGWYGGHYVPSYSLLFPPLARALGIYGVAACSAAVATWSFHRLALSRWGRSAQLGSALFAAGTVVPVAIGQLPFLLGEALGLLALIAMTRRRRVLAVALALLASLASPVAGAFLGLAVVALVLSRSDSRWFHGTVALAAVAPAAVSGLFDAQSGRFPFYAGQLLAILGLAVALILRVPRDERVLRRGIALYACAAVVVFAVPNPMGGNMGRLAATFAPAITLIVARAYRLRLVALLVVPALVWQWAPVAGAAVRGARDASGQAAYFAPVLQRLASDPHQGRLEIPFTRAHWEAAYVAPHVPLARGWERQTDLAVNEIFYRRGALTPETYRAWLSTSGVRWVALPDVPLDYSAQAEARLITSGLGYLRPVWHNAHWKLWEVRGSPGLVSGPVRLLSVGPDRFVVDASGPGVGLVRLRFTPAWNVRSGPACVRPSSDGWTELVVSAAGRVDVGVSTLPSVDREPCPLSPGVSTAASRLGR